jgi:hypothetical protein
MGVDVHEPRKDHGAIGVDRPGSGRSEAPDVSDDAVDYPDIGGARRRSCPVDHGSAADDQVELRHR